MSVNLETSSHLTLLSKNLRFGTETVTYRVSLLRNLIPDKIRNVSSLKNFKREIK